MLNVIMLSVANKPLMLNVIMVDVVMLSAVMLSAVMLSAVMLSAVMLNVVAPLWAFSDGRDVEGNTEAGDS
jgi:hypothetical protein